MFYFAGSQFTVRILKSVHDACLRVWHMRTHSLSIYCYRTSTATVSSYWCDRLGSLGLGVRLSTAAALCYNTRCSDTCDTRHRRTSAIRALSSAARGPTFLRTRQSERNRSLSARIGMYTLCFFVQSPLFSAVWCLLNTSTRSSWPSCKVSS